MWLKLILVVVVLMHAVGHLLFLVPTLGVAHWADQTGHSWAMTSAIGDSPARAIGTLLWVATIVLFVAGVAGFLMAQPWWAGVTIAASVLSIVGIVLMWDGIATTNAVMALVVDVAIIVSLVWVHWPSLETVGS